MWRDRGVARVAVAWSWSVVRGDTRAVAPPVSWPAKAGHPRLPAAPEVVDGRPAAAMTRRTAATTRRTATVTPWHR